MLKLAVREDFSGALLSFKQWRFPCGEVGIKIGDETGIPFVQDEDVVICCDFEGNDDLFAIGQTVDALRQLGPKTISLLLPYFPYARQDRRRHLGEGHGLKVVANYINSLDFDCVVTYDAHSTVLEALVDKLVIVPQEECAWDLPKFDFLVAPDAGAEKKIFKHEQVEHGNTSVLCASKVRAEGGKITGVHLENPWQLDDLNVCVVDDLCDGGATFIELGKHIKQNSGPAKLSLYVTHGMFTKGLDALLEIYDNIYVHNLPNKAYEGQVTII